MSTSSDLNKWKGFQSRKLNVICWVCCIIRFPPVITPSAAECWWYLWEVSGPDGDISQTLVTPPGYLQSAHTFTSDKSTSLRCLHKKSARSGENVTCHQSSWMLWLKPPGGKSMTSVLQLEHNFIRHNNGVWMTLLITFHPAPPSRPPLPHFTWRVSEWDFLQIFVEN